MTTPPPIPASHAYDTAKGYLSEEHKRKFTITAGVLGGIFFLAQFVLPFAVMLAIMPAMMLFQRDIFRDANLRGGTYWDGAVWYVESGFAGNQEAAVSLHKVIVGGEDESSNVAELEIHNPWLLGDQDRIWIISPSAVGYYQDGRVNLAADAQQLGDISRPFLYDGRPAVVERTPARVALMVLADGGWREVKRLPWGDSEERFAVERDVQIVGDADIMHVFWKFGGTIYYRQGLPEEGTNDQESWQTVCPAGYWWYAILFAGQPMVVTPQHRDSPSSVLEGLSLKDGKWEKVFSRRISMASNFGVFPTRDSHGLVVLTQMFPGSLRVVEFDGPEVKAEKRYGSGFPFPRGMMAMVFIPHLGTFVMPLILAFILSAFMRKHRVGDFRSETAEAQFAPLKHRAVAQLIDGVILAAPMLVAYLILMPAFFDFEKMFDRMGGIGVLAMPAMMVGGLIWCLACFAVFAVLEGRFGATPGKWVMRIRVFGTDLRPCGFGRALLRNLLKFVDGFFNFMVGVLVVALSENWQRVGDMAARTVVVMKQPVKKSRWDGE